MNVKEAIAIATKISPTGWERYREANRILVKEIERLHAGLDGLRVLHDSQKSEIICLLAERVEMVAELAELKERHRPVWNRDELREAAEAEKEV